MTIEGAVVSEKDQSARVTLRVSAPLARTFKFSYNMSEGSAVSPDDFTAASGLFQIHAGRMFATITIPIRDDDVTEGTESFDVVVPFNLNSSLPLAATVTIIDDDGAARRRSVHH